MIDVNWPAVCRLVEMSGCIDACACSLLVCLILSSVVVHLNADKHLCHHVLCSSSTQFEPGVAVGYHQSTGCHKDECLNLASG